MSLLSRFRTLSRIRAVPEPDLPDSAGNATRLVISKLPEGSNPIPIDDATLEPADTLIL